MQQVLSTPMQLGQILASARKSRKLTQQAAAARLALSQSRISALELDAGAITIA
jgi:HTH-type transcriptional regulator/antitoxin HipB